MSFWEYDEGTPRPRTIHEETSFPVDEFWDLWKNAYRIEEDEPKDLLFLSDVKISRRDVPSWFGRCGVEVSCWTHERLGSVISRLDGYSLKSVVVEFRSRRSTVWHGGDPSVPLVLYGVSTSEIALPVDRKEQLDDSKQAMRAFLAGAEKRHAENQKRCKSRR